MRLWLRLPEVRPEEYVVPLSCPYGCGGQYFALHAKCRKAIRDPNYQEVRVRRFKCVKCGGRFWVHLTGVSGHHRSQRLRGIEVMLHIPVGTALAPRPPKRSHRIRHPAIGQPQHMQAAGEAVPRLRRQVHVVNADATHVVCHGQDATIAVALDAAAGDVLAVELVDSEAAAALLPFLAQLQAEYGMEVLDSDGHDSHKTLADELGVAHSICRAHVNRNVARLTAELAE